MSVSQTKIENRVSNDVQSGTILNIFSLLFSSAVRQNGGLMGCLGETLVFAEIVMLIFYSYYVCWIWMYGCKMPKIACKENNMYVCILNQGAQWFCIMCCSTELHQQQQKESPYSWHILQISRYLNLKSISIAIWSLQSKQALDSDNMHLIQICIKRKQHYIWTNKQMMALRSVYLNKYSYTTLLISMAGSRHTSPINFVEILHRQGNVKTFMNLSIPPFDEVKKVMVSFIAHVSSFYQALSKCVP